MNNKKDAYLHSKGNNWYDFWGEQYIIFVSCKRYNIQICNGIFLPGLPFSNWEYIVCEWLLWHIKLTKCVLIYRIFLYLYVHIKSILIDWFIITCSTLYCFLSNWPEMTRVLNRLQPAIWISFIGRLFLMAALIILLPLISSWKFSSCLEISTKYSKASATQSSKSTIVAMYSITFRTFPSFGTGPVEIIIIQSLNTHYLNNRYIQSIDLFECNKRWNCPTLGYVWYTVNSPYLTFDSFPRLLSLSFF